MFGSIAAFYIYKGKLQAAKMTKDGVFKDAVECAWNTHSLLQVFEKIKKLYRTKTARIILGCDISHVVSFLVPKEYAADRLYIKEKAQGLISTDLDDTVWDFKNIYIQGDSVLIQVVCIIKSFVEKLSSLLDAANISVSSMEPASYALARLTKDEKSPHCILYKNASNCLVFAYRGIVLRSMEQIDNNQKLIFYIESIKDIFGTTVEKLLLGSGCSRNDIPKALKGIPVEQKVLHPLIGIAAEHNDAIFKEKVLSREENIKKFATKSDKEEDQLHRKKYYIHNIKKAMESFLCKIQNPKIFVAVSVLILCAFSGKIAYQKRKQLANETNGLTTVTSITPTPTLVQIELSKYSVHVLNGSGVAGQAGYVKDILQKNGFKKIDIGNASNYAFKDTSIGIKEVLAEILYPHIIEILENEYTVSLNEQRIADDSNYDLIIIVGSKK